MLIRTDENEVRLRNPVCESPTIEGMAWVGFFFRRLKGEGLSLPYRIPDLLRGEYIAAIDPDLSHWHRTGMVGFKLRTLKVPSGYSVHYGTVPVGAINGKDTKHLIRCLYGNDPIVMEIMMRDPVIRALDEVTG